MCMCTYYRVDYVTGLVEEKKNEFEQMKIDHEAKIAKITKASRKSRLKQRQAAGVGTRFSITYILFSCRLILYQIFLCLFCKVMRR